MESLNVNVKNWKALIKPTQLDVKISDDKSHAKIIAEPLEKGYGLNFREFFKKNFTFINKRCCSNIYSN